MGDVPSKPEAKRKSDSELNEEKIKKLKLITFNDSIMISDSESDDEPTSTSAPEVSGKPPETSSSSSSDSLNNSDRESEKSGTATEKPEESEAVAAQNDSEVVDLTQPKWCLGVVPETSDTIIVVDDLEKTVKVKETFTIDDSDEEDLQIESEAVEHLVTSSIYDKEFLKTDDIEASHEKVSEPDEKVINSQENFITSTSGQKTTERQENSELEAEKLLENTKIVEDQQEDQTEDESETVPAVETEQNETPAFGNAENETPATELTGNSDDETLYDSEATVSYYNDSEDDKEGSGAETDEVPDLMSSVDDKSENNDSSGDKLATDEQVSDEPEKVEINEEVQNASQLPDTVEIPDLPENSSATQDISEVIVEQRKVLEVETQQEPKALITATALPVPPQSSPAVITPEIITSPEDLAMSHCKEVLEKISTKILASNESDEIKLIINRTKSHFENSSDNCINHGELLEATYSKLGSSKEAERIRNEERLAKLKTAFTELTNVDEDDLDRWSRGDEIYQAILKVAGENETLIEAEPAFEVTPYKQFNRFISKMIRNDIKVTFEMVYKKLAAQNEKFNFGLSSLKIYEIVEDSCRKMTELDKKDRSSILKNKFELLVDSLVDPAENDLELMRKLRENAKMVEKGIFDLEL